MTGWLLIVWVVMGGYAHAEYPSQIGPFATERACEQAASIIAGGPGKNKRFGACVSQTETAN